MINGNETSRHFKNHKKINIKKIIQRYRLDNNYSETSYFNKIKNIILFSLLISAIIGLIIFFIINNPKSYKKVFQLSKLDTNNLNKDGYYIPKDISSEIIYKKCSIENCKKCYGNSYYDICTSCSNSYYPIYDIKNETIISCERYIPKTEFNIEIITDKISDIKTDILTNIKTEFKTTSESDIKTDRIEEKTQIYITEINSNSAKETKQDKTYEIDFSTEETIPDTKVKTTELSLEETTDIIAKTTAVLSSEVKNFDISTELNQETSYIDITSENSIIDCDPGYYLPEGINTEKKCKQCSLGCEKCHGDNIINYCENCFSNYVPRYINNNLLCNIEIEKNCIEYQIINDKFNCLRCDNEYVLYGGKCLSYSFEAVYYTTSNNQNLQLISLDSYFIDAIILDGKSIEPENKSLIEEKGYHTAYFFLKNNLTSFKNLFSPFLELFSVKFTSHIRTKNITNLSGMFGGCRYLVSIEFSNFDTSNVEDMSYMFFECFELKTINLQSFDTSKVLDMNHMFECCHRLDIINIGNFDLSKVTNFGLMFHHCKNLTSLVLPFDKGNNKTRNMNYMFSHCYILTSIDLSKIDTTNVKYMNSMFRECNSLKTIHFNKCKNENIEEMKYMFYNCYSITSLDLDNFYTSKVERMDQMFYNCTKLIYLSIINFSGVSLLNCNNYMFQKVNKSIKIITNDDFIKKIQNCNMGF